MQTWENNGKPESQDPIPRETAMLENPKIKEYLDIKVISGEANEDTYEKLGEFETALKKRVVAFIKKAPLNAGNPKEVFTWCERLENNLSYDEWQTLPD